MLAFLTLLPFWSWRCFLLQLGLPDLGSCFLALFAVPVLVTSLYPASLFTFVFLAPWLCFLFVGLLWPITYGFQVLSFSFLIAASHIMRSGHTPKDIAFFLNNFFSPATSVGPWVQAAALDAVGDHDAEACSRQHRYPDWRGETLKEGMLAPEGPGTLEQVSNKKQTS